MAGDGKPAKALIRCFLEKFQNTRKSLSITNGVVMGTEEEKMVATARITGGTLISSWASQREREGSEVKVDGEGGSGAHERHSDDALFVVLGLVSLEL